jgi:hypothetical protein
MNRNDRVSLNRRHFLKMVGATAFTYPFLRGVPSFAAPNNGGANPVNLVLLFTPCGTIRYLWGATGPAPTGTTPTSTAVTNGPLTFRQRLQPLAQAGPSMQADLTKYVTVLDGLENKAGAGGTHESGMASMWTGLTTSGTAVTGPSIDQVIASVIPKATWPSVNLLVQSAADNDSANVDARPLYTLAGGYVNPNTTPQEAISQLFPQMMMQTGPNKQAIIRQEVLNHINADLTSLQSRLCTEDRQQMANLQALWNSVVMSLNGAATASLSCSTPTADAGSLGAGACSTTDSFYAYSQVMPNILTLTLACGLTNVSSLQFSQAHSATVHCWLGSHQTDTHHNYSHTGPTYIGALGSDLYTPPTQYEVAGYTGTGSNTYAEQLEDIETWYSQQVANFAYSLSQFGPTGSTLLDNTVVCWGSEIDMGFAHNHDDTPFVLIGGAGGKLKAPSVGGQLVRFPLVNLGQSAQNNQCGVRFHNDLLLTLAQIMGVSAAQVQSAYGSNWSVFNQYVNGPITEILT